MDGLGLNDREVKHGFPALSDLVRFQPEASEVSLSEVEEGKNMVGLDKHKDTSFRAGRLEALKSWQ